MPHGLYDWVVQERFFRVRRSLWIIREFYGTSPNSIGGRVNRTII